MRDLFTTLQPGEVRTLFERTWVYGGWMHVVITLSPTGDRVIVASDSPMLDMLQTYRLRWAVENLPAALKTRGFNLEDTEPRLGLGKVVGENGQDDAETESP